MVGSAPTRRHGERRAKSTYRWKHSGLEDARPGAGAANLPGRARARAPPVRAPTFPLQALNGPTPRSAASFLTGLAACLAAAALPACGSSEAATPVLRITALPDAQSTELSPKYRLAADALSNELDVAVEYVPVTDYGASVEAFKNGDVQLAWFGGVTGVQARHAVPGARAIAFGKIDPEFRSYFIANADAGVEPSDSFPMSLRGKRFTFGAADSTSGRIMPRHFVIRETGEAPRTFFAETNENGGKHPIVAKNVEKGVWEAGAMNFKTYDDMVARGELDPTRCVKVWTTPSYPDYNWTAHPSLEETFGAGFTDRLQAALVAIDDPELLAALQRPEGLIEASNADFTAIETICRDVGLIRD